MFDLKFLTELDFRFPVGAPIHGIWAFLTTNQLQVTTALMIISIPYQFDKSCIFNVNILDLNN